LFTYFFLAEKHAVHAGACLEVAAVLEGDSVEVEA
jgi:hypothetical protein